MIKSILFVCMGNICRSAAAEGVLKKICEDKSVDITIDSAGTIGYHAGEKADKRMREFAFERGYRLESISREVIPQDFYKFDIIIAMDNNNVRDLRKVAHKAALLQNNGEENYNLYDSKICKLTDYSSEEFLIKNGGLTEVPDPYYGGAAGFKLVMDILEDACANIADFIKK